MQGGDRERRERRGWGVGGEKRVNRAKARLSRAQRHTETGSQRPLSVQRTSAEQVSSV